jgi:surfactin synthase thioesterase subunit
VKLICLAHAGGGAASFRDWWRELRDVEVLPVQLPGRERRFHEAPLSSVAEIVEQLAVAAGDVVEEPFAVFGHSMGALIGYELVRKLRDERGMHPTTLFVAGARAPHVPPRERPRHELGDAEFIEQLRALKGTPAAVLDSAELMELTLPILRADFAAIETHVHSPGEPLDCPITAFGGLRDVDVAAGDLAAWAELTRAEFQCTMFEGDHFFVQSSRDRLLAAMRAQLVG